MLRLISAQESLYVILLLALILAVLIANVFSSKYHKLWSPLTVVALTYLYYTVAGPVLSIYLDDTYVRLLDHRPFFLNSWKGALLSFIFIIIGYVIIGKIKIERQEINFNLDLKKFGLRLYAIGFAGVILAFGFSSISSINFLSGDHLEQTAIGGGFSNYFLFMMNLFIPACCIFLVKSIQKNKYSWLFIVSVLYPVALYITLGFRYRVILLVLSLLTTYHLYLMKRPNFLALSLFSVLIITFMGIIGSTRTYFSGLKNLDRIENKSFGDLFVSGFSEAQTFQSTGLLIQNVPTAHDFMGLQAIYETIAMPIPRQFWPGKPSGESLDAMYSIYEYEVGSGDVSTGAAILNYGENYLAFGWLGVIMGAFILGLLLRYSWNWFLNRKDNALAIVYIAVLNSFIYVVISRGYLPQVVINFFFTVFPVYLLYKNSKSKNQV